MSTVVLYHDNCPDGFCAAWLAWKRFGNDAKYIPVQYNNPPPEDIHNNNNVYILDFSYKRPVMEELSAKVKSLVVLDHHKTAEEELRNFPRGHVVFDMQKSGAMLAWEYFHDKQIEAPPWLVQYVQDRDLWTWKLPDSKVINDAISSYKQDFEVWDNLNRYSTPSELVVEGTAIKRYKDQVVDKAVSNAIEIDFFGHKVLTTNATNLISEIAGKLAEGRPFGATFFINKAGKKVWSLRSRDAGIDVSALAKSKGGGGHRNAAGFTVD